MAKRLFDAKKGLCSGLWLVAALCAVSAGTAQKLPINAPELPINAPEPLQPVKARALPDQLSIKPSQPPAFRIPVEALGFSAPGAFYLGQRDSFVSLDFLDEDRLLFTFHVPGLIHRAGAEHTAGIGDERQIRALLFRLPAGAVEAEALWTVHDRQRSLWMLNDGHFLLRDRETLEVGDAALELKPFLRFPGPLVWLEMDPAQQLLVTNTREVATPKTDGDSSLEVRILRRDTGKVLLVSRAVSAVHLPINSDGYLESEHADGNLWLLKMNSFSGGSNVLSHVESTCSPIFDFLSQRELLVTACAANGAGELIAMTTAGRRLWQAQTSSATAWPLMLPAPNGLRLAREALAITHPVNGRSIFDQEEITGQLVEILDAADGKVALETSASPVLDAGGNVAISPSGRRVAVLNGGAIQIFELPLPPPLPASVASPPGN
jgi:hypothetical protein